MNSQGLVNDHLDVAPSSDVLHENPMVLPSSHRKSVHSSMKMVWRYARSSVNPNTVIPALLFSRYVTANQGKSP
jgi:hypothetical protein